MNDPLFRSIIKCAAFLLAIPMFFSGCSKDNGKNNGETGAGNDTTAAYTEDNANTGADANITDPDGNYLRDRISITSEHYKVNNAMMSYFFSSTVSSIVSNYSSYYGSDIALYYGMIPDTTKPLRDQTNNATGQTWYDYMIESAVDYVESMLVLAEGAYDEEMKLTDFEKNLIEDFFVTLNDIAEEEKTTIEQIITENFGIGVKESDLRDAFELYYLSEMYYYKIISGLTATEEEILAYYEAHTDDFDNTDDAPTKNVRHILFSFDDYENKDDCKANAETVLDHFIANNGDEEMFAELAKLYSSDTGSSMLGGLYENVPKGEMVKEFENWIFDESREVGDTGIVETSYGYHVMYFSGEGLPSWQADIYDEITYEKYYDIVDELYEKHQVTINEDLLDNIPDIA